MSGRVGLGYDVHPFGAEGTLVLGGVTLDGPGLVGHSDGDAVTHAVADALLGALAMGDLGTLFPASDDQWAGARSLELLADVATRVADAGWRVVNVDVVVAAERPRLAPFVAAMAANLADALDPALDGNDPDGLPAVSVKPKFGEGVGAVGRGEAVAVWAIALLEPASAH
ncbi:MAG TPA: 2-C-methyl-D-erythritol 2,4-cyclodiphosphate synthase [Acidimicrobiia bacterium]|nr:2-C-methyl-D-erythritol 2,4-cyclodiphosphate synthase [Acidimicrobiia bacterium]